MTKLKVRARAVDMLGRQQIAGIPTAIHELFKNAHDAYAERVEVDYFRRNGVLIIRDDGYGMTRNDVETRWLTLGTESRVGANRAATESSWRGPKNLPKRSIMGEKGIGRLAIAVIAPITILMSRAVRADGLHDLVVALVHWGIFEQPGLDLNDIDVPIETFDGGRLPGRDDIGALIDKVACNLKSLQDQIEHSAYINLLASLEKIKVVAPDLLDKTLSKDSDMPLSLAEEGHGTHFIMMPVAPELNDDIDGGTDKESSKLERNLLGFSNSMANDIPVIRTEFRDHTAEGTIQRIGSREFFANDDFSRTDQYFEGTFDEFGQFVGIVSVYGEQRKFVSNWIEGKGRKTKCGPFNFRYGYVQGRATETRLNPSDWESMIGKCDKVGGLYIYRDGIRILPYGNSDVDWIDMERRRNLSNKDWFFAYRRGFGYVAITHSENGTLTEKAGREGFRENQAYRDFRSVIMGLFKQLAIEFFKPNAIQGDDFWAGKKHFSLQSALLKKQKEKADSRRETLRTDLDNFFEKYNDGFFEREGSSIQVHTKDRLEMLTGELDLGEFASKIRLLELETKHKIRFLIGQAQLSLPRGLALTKKMDRDWSAYDATFRLLQESIFTPLQLEVDKLFSSATSGKIDSAERRKTALQDIEREKDSAIRDIVILRREATEAATKMQAAVNNVLKEIFSDLRTNAELLVADFTKRSADAPTQLDALQREIGTGLDTLKSRDLDLLESFKRQMLDLTDSIKDRETLDDRFAALEARNQVLEDQIEFFSDFAQLGMSVGILQHEFHNAVRGIRSAMSELKVWADRNPPLAVIYKNLRDHIDHLDGYLKVLDPLGRRMYRSTVKLSGDEILGVILNVFAEPISNTSINIKPTFAFRDHIIECKSSVIIGAFINIIDNAIHWLNTRASGEKNIYLDSDGEGFLISNNGPGIEARFQNSIFEFGETKKAGGRGMGLAISREVLRRDGFDLNLVEFGAENNPVFRISSLNSTEGNEEDL
ncbi:ATP-binding protein [Pseudomonas sp. B21-012]|uniref:ATP-binding protein n=1 Tax=Pseudomonas sp. B21-012 TaxID=2895472 RepID=UPI00215EE69B|nr:ATP-binding protein [Pseudomonas sp. B21-012]UVM54083.1 ATP-binding protein [Pseudomonas sp. B21-012]